MTTVPYEVVDVFTDRAFAGNPLAVVFDADALSKQQLQAIANEFNLSETAFLLPASQPEASYRVRIFTPTEELPFAGHPSVGTAVTAIRRGVVTPGPGGVVVQECGAGLLPLAVAGDQATLTGGTPTIEPPRAPGPLLAAVGLTEADFAGPPPRAAGCGLPFTYLPVRPEAVARARLSATGAGADEISVFAWDPATRTAHARVFVPGLGVSEDPATGSAALGLGVWLVASGLLPGEGESGYVVLQGAEIGRPSRLECTVTASGGAAVSATVTGSVVPIARGEITVPPG